MIWKKCLIATALLFLALHGAMAEEANTAPDSVQAFLQSLQTPAVSPVTPEGAGVPEALPLVVPPGSVACCRAFPLCCSTTATEDACNDLGGSAFPTTQMCARECCT